MVNGELSWAFTSFLFVNEALKKYVGELGRKSDCERVLFYKWVLWLCGLTCFLFTFTVSFGGGGKWWYNDKFPRKRNVKDERRNLE